MKPRTASTIKQPLLPLMPITVIGSEDKPPFDSVFAAPGTDLRKVVDRGHSSLHWARFYTALENWCQTDIIDNETKPVRSYQRGATKRSGRPPKRGDVHVFKVDR